jgi:hypothetical protein
VCEIRRVSDDDNIVIIGLEDKLRSLITAVVVV